jgi:Ca2+-dependent lipid-binding protein
MKGPVGPKVIDLTEGKPVKKVEEMKPVEEKEEDEDDIDDDEEMSASDQEDYEVEDEDFSWYNDSKLKDSTYFVLVNCDRRTIRKGEQAFYCYGKRSNAFLILK